MRARAPEPPAPPPGRAAPAASGSRCKGSSFDCSSFVPGACSGQKGCRMESRYVADGIYSGHFENECKGAAAYCDELDTESACQRQRGCRWE